MGDGSYLRAWPKIAIMTPSVAFLSGVALGALHPHEVYTYSLLVVAVLAIIAGLGAGIGLWATCGFSVGDLFFSHKGVSSHLGLGFDLSGLRSFLALGLSYVLLAGLLVLVPVMAHFLRLGMLRLTGIFTLASSVLVAVQATLAFFWTQSTPFLIRPIWSYFGRVPEVNAIEPLQQRGWAIAIAMGLSAVMRLLLERAASTTLDPFDVPSITVGTRVRSPIWLQVAGRTAFAAFMLSGLFSTWLSALFAVLALAVISYLHIKVIPKLTRYVRLLANVPLALRLVAATLFAYFAGILLVESAVERGSGSFDSLVVATIISLFFIAWLIPERPGEISKSWSRASS